MSMTICEAVCVDITYISEGEVPTGRLEVHEPVLTDSPVDSHLTNCATRAQHCEGGHSIWIIGTLTLWEQNLRKTQVPRKKKLVNVQLYVNRK